MPSKTRVFDLPLTSRELQLVLGLARYAARDAEIFDMVAEIAGVSDTYMRTLRDKLNEFDIDRVTARKPTLREKQDDLWASDDEFPVGDWVAEVVSGDTHLGYWEWVDNEREAAKHEHSH